MVMHIRIVFFLLCPLRIFLLIILGIQVNILFRKLCFNNSCTCLQWFPQHANSPWAKGDPLQCISSLSFQRNEYGSFMGLDRISG